MDNMYFLVVLEDKVPNKHFANIHELWCVILSIDCKKSWFFASSNLQSHHVPITAAAIPQHGIESLCYPTQDIVSTFTIALGMHNSKNTNFCCLKSSHTKKSIFVYKDIYDFWGCKYNSGLCKDTLVNNEPCRRLGFPRYHEGIENYFCLVMP